jgi:hypothetical protein
MKESLKYIEDVSTTSLKLYGHLEHRMKFLLGKDFILTNEQEDKIYNAIRDVLEEHCETGDYKHHN